MLVPGLTDQPEHIEALSKHLSRYENIERIELLPFHQMATYKWQELGLEYKLADVKEPTKEEMINALAIFKIHNLNVLMN